MIVLTVWFVIVFAIIGVWQAGNLRQSQQVMSRDSLPFLIRSQEFQKVALRLRQEVRQVPFTTTRDELDVLRGTISDEMDELNSIELPSVNTNEVFQRVEQLWTQLERMRQSSDELFGLQAEILDINQELSRLSADVESQIQSMATDIDQLIFESTERSTNMFARVDALGASDTLEPDGQTVRDVFWEAVNLSELSNRLLGASDIFNSISVTSDGEAIQDAKVKLQFRARGIVRLVSELPESQLRTQIANSTLNLTRLLDGRDSFFELALARSELQRQISDLVESQQQKLEAISSQASELVQTSLRNVSISLADLNSKSQQLTFAMVLTAAVIIGLMGIMFYFVVERQINRRMASLTHSVQSIADGDLSVAIETTGSDEIGQITDALKVFRSNAQNLEQTNIELEQFAYVAAHDLRSPLSAIHDLTVWTLDDQDNTLSEDSKENLGLIQQRVLRLSNLLSALLKYSRVGRDTLVYSTVNLQEFVEEQIAILDLPDGFQVRYSGPDDVVRIHALPLQPVLWNLINNAIKHHDQDTGLIEINARRASGWVTIEVTDDGPGIDANYHERIFELFQTLKSRDDVEGSGLGLAIVRKLVLACGGRVDIKPTPDDERGATFVIDMPENSGETSRTQRSIKKEDIV